MAIEYRWDIENLECIPSQDGLQDVVCKASWKYSGSDEDMYSATRFGIVDLPSPESDSFIAYDQLDESTVALWVAEQITADRVLEMQTEIEQEIAALRSPPAVTKPLPWRN